MVNKDYVLNIAKQRQIKSFVIRDARGDVVLLSDNPASLTDRYDELESFLKNSSGVYKVELRNVAGKGLFPPAKQRASMVIGEFDVVLETQTKQNGIEGLDIMSGMGGMGGFQAVRSYEKEIRDLERANSVLENKIAIFQMQMEQMKKEHETELANAKSQDNKIMGYLSKFSDIMVPTPQRTMNGMGETGMETDKKQKVLAAVNKLMAIDENIADNLTKLANLAETNPQMYKQAVTMLNSMA